MHDVYEDYTFGINDTIGNAIIPHALNMEYGNCPAPSGAGVCVEECSSDTECSGAEICCFNGCGHVCMIEPQ